MSRVNCRQCGAQARTYAEYGEVCAKCVSSLSVEEIEQRLRRLWLGHRQPTAEARGKSINVCLRRRRGGRKGVAPR